MTSNQAEMPPELDELDGLRAEFPGHEIWRELTPGGTRYVARSPSLKVHPHTVVTADLGELREALHQAQKPRGLTLVPGPADQPETARRSRAITRSVLDLIWKIDYARGAWSGTLRNDPSVVVTARNGDELARLTSDLTLAILQGRGREAVAAAMAAC